MDTRDILENNSQYAGRISEFGRSRLVLSTGSVKKEYERYEKLTSIGIMDIPNPVVLDVGCGTSNFYAFLISKGFIGTYIGLDISQEMLNISKERFPNNSYICNELADVASKLGQVDFIVSSQTFNRRLKHGDNYTEVKKFISLSRNLARFAIAFDLLSLYVDFHEEKHFYYSPEVIFGYCKNIFKKVNLLHDLEGFEFTIQIKK